ncbi:MAG TPA: LysR family transcriptional regulator [Clostridiales bacterium]|nr:LysR family transcriptional regulator [Clostridiales bacterium]
MTIYQIEAFITLARTLNYTKASKLLHTTQPNLSKMIVNMEQELGVRLFTRNKRDVSLSPAGMAFLPQAERLLEVYDKAIADAREAEMGIRGNIKVGFLGSAMHARMPAIVRAFKEKYPKIYLELIDYTFSPLMTALVEHRIDVAMLPDKELEFIPKLEKKFIFSDDMCAVVPKNHRLADCDFINIQDLKHEPFIMMDPKVSDRDYNLVNSICMEGGFIPNVVYQGNTLTNLMLMVACGFGVSILARHMTHLGMDDVSFVPIKGYEGHFKMVCAWRRDSNPSIPKLIEVINSDIS